VHQTDPSNVAGQRWLQAIRDHASPPEKRDIQPFMPLNLSFRPQRRDYIRGKSHSPFWVWMHQSGITKKLPIQTGLDHLFNDVNDAAMQRCLVPWIRPLDSRDGLYIFMKSI
jgi:hypothetical protein